jgi:acyl-CoA thioesterase
LLPFLTIFFFLLEKSVSHDHSSFFGSGEIEKKLAFEVSNLKMELVLCQAKLESERHDRQTVEQALHAQVIATGKRKDDAMSAVQEASEKAEILKKECDGNLGSFVLNCFLTSIFLF